MQDSKRVVELDHKGITVHKDSYMRAKSTSNSGFGVTVLKYWDYYATIPIDCLK